MDESLLFWAEEYFLHYFDIVAVFGQIVHRSNGFFALHLAD